jgi:predicted transcriptional regulator
MKVLAVCGTVSIKRLERPLMANDVAVGPMMMIPAELDEALAQLAEARGIPKTALIVEALNEFVFYEEADAEFVAAVEEARADVRAGRVVSHDEVVREMEELLARKR